MSLLHTRRSQYQHLSHITSKLSYLSIYRNIVVTGPTRFHSLPHRRQFSKSVSNNEFVSSYSYRIPAIERPLWALNHDAIFVIKKLGQGAFGEVSYTYSIATVWSIKVYLAEYVGKSTERVAVKTMRGEVYCRSWIWPNEPFSGQSRCS